MKCVVEISASNIINLQVSPDTLNQFGEIIKNNKSNMQPTPKC